MQLCQKSNRRLYTGSEAMTEDWNYLKTFFRFRKEFPTTLICCWMKRTVLFDTVDNAVGRQFLENIAAVLNGRTLDYLVINHMEPDHCALIEDLHLRYPDMKLIGNAKTFPMIDQFYGMDLGDKKIIIKEGETFSCGKHTLHFVMAPMVHWPEAMMTYDETDKVLFSADAFGTFGALDGVIFNDEMDFDRDYLDEARRYYTNIVGKYGIQVTECPEKAAALDIQMICRCMASYGERISAGIWTSICTGALTHRRSRAS